MVSFLVVLLIVLTSLLCYEYYCLKKEAADLLALKKRYTEYALALKKQVRSENSAGELYPQLPLYGEHGGDLSCDESSEQKLDFLVLNREPSYLRSSALAFAREHDLEWALEQLYTANDWTIATNEVCKKSPIKRATPRMKSAGASRTHMQAMRTVPKASLFIWPIDRSKFWISSPFGPRKKKHGRWGFHYGVDLAAVKGTPVRAAADGVVEESTYEAGYGNTVVIVHDKKFKTRYAHLDRRTVKEKQQVKQGQEIGTVGNTGHVVSSFGGDGTHLHFEIYVFDKRVNPVYFMP